jgi:glucose/arabinose dehydrogenase
MAPARGIAPARRVGPWLALVALALASLTVESVAALRLPTGFYDRTVAEQLRRPVGMAFLPDGRLFVVERETGIVKLVVPGPPPVVDSVLQVDSLRVDYFEQGLLGVAVDPGWPSRPYAYFFYDALGYTMRISRFQASGDLADPTSANLLLDPASRYDVMNDIPDESESHNGGTLRFGPDGMLYAGLADDWVLCSSQDSVSLRGALIRIDVSALPDGPGGPADKALLAPPDNPWFGHPDPNARLVWATGFRNPFRFQIDPVDGSLFVTDVGWSAYEEIDHVEAPGQNFGWPFYEGNAPMHPSCTPGPGVFFTPPILVDDRRTQNLAVLVSAGVYRPAPCSDCNFPPEYDGDYFYGDYYRGFIRRLHHDENGWSPAPAVPGQPSAPNWADGYIEVTDFAMGPDGALWYCRTSEFGYDYSGHIGRIFQYVPGPASVETGTAAESFAPPSPSPARDHVQFSFTMARAGRARLEVFDPAGRRIATVFDAPLDAGTHRTGWAVRGADRHPPAGVYFARLVVDGIARQRRFVIAR